MNWSYQGTKACTVLVGENTDAKPSSSEANKTSTSSTSTSSQSGGRTRQPSSSGGSISTSDSMLLDGVVYSRKRRDAFNEHALHQTVALPPPRDPEEPSLTPTVLEAETSGFEQRSVPLHDKFPGKIVHDSEHADGPGPAKEAVDRSIEAVEVTEESLVVNVSATTTNYSHDHTTHITVADHLSSSSSVSVGSGHSSASTFEFNRESPDDEVSGTTSSWFFTEIFPAVDKDTVDVLEKSAMREEHVATKVPIAKLVRDHSADFDRDTDNASTSESSDIGESGDGIEATTSASDAESAKLGADSSDYDRVVGGTTENDSNVSPVDYNGNIDAADTIVEAVTEVRSIELTEDQGSNVSNLSTSEQLVSVEMDRNKVDASTISPNINNNKTAFNVLLNNDKKIGEPEEDIIKIEDNYYDKSKEKIISNENNRPAVFTEDISKTINMTTKSIKSQTSDIVKETRELSQESSSSESEASLNIVNSPEQSEELQKDYPVPIYSYGQDEVEIVDLHHKKQSIAKTKNPTKTSEIFDNDVKMNVVSREDRKDKDDLQIIMREESDNELLRKFHEAAIDANEPVENSSLIKTNSNSPPTNTLHETMHDSSDNASPRFPSNTDHLSNSPITQRVQIVEVPVYRDAHSGSSSSSSSSPHRVLINVTIAAENPSAASSRPLYVLSVSVPTEDGHSSGINIDQAQVPPASMKKIPAKDAESISVVDTRLPPPPQPPALPPAPIWAGGECECSCPCMGSSSDEWDNFSAIDDNLEQELESINATLSDDEFLESKEESANKKEQDTESAVKDSAKSNETISTTENYLSSMDDLAENSESIDGSSTSTYEPEVSTEPWACSGSTALPPEPTILILEGEATFTIVSLFLFLFLFLSLSICLIFFQDISF